MSAIKELLSIALVLLSFASCKSGTPQRISETDAITLSTQVQEILTAITAETQASENIDKEQTESMLELAINGAPVSVKWEDNESVQALRELAAKEPITVQMSMYGGFEQVGSIGTDLPQNNVQTTTSSGDIVLYSGNQMVVFYGSNTWAYTRLGHITDKTQAELTELLSNGNVTITLSH
jgi:hypothetical protein